MSGRRKQIGFSQRIRLEWLERTANLALSGFDRDAAYQALQELLQDQLSVDGNAKRGNREKAITILMKIWITVPKGLEAFRDEGLSLLRNLPTNDRIAIHWGMSMAGYPFWGTVAESTGRLLCLQGNAVAAQIQRRVRELLGERETVSRAARRILRSYVDWGVLRETAQKGIYEQGTVRGVDDPQAVTWLISAALMASEANSAPLTAITEGPALFPFHLARPTTKELEECSRLECFRHALDEETVVLRGRLTKRTKSDRPHGTCTSSHR